MHRYQDQRRYRLSLRNATLGLPIINSRFFRRSLFDKLGRFDLAYTVASDREFLIRASLAGITDVCTSEIFYRYLWHSGSLTMNAGNRSMLKGLEDGLEMIRKTRASAFIGPPEDRTLREWQGELQATMVLLHAVMRDGDQASRGGERIVVEGSALAFHPLALRGVCDGPPSADKIPELAKRMSSEARRIRVLHLIDSLDLGGAQTAIFAWLQAHDRNRFEVHLAAIHGTPKSLFYERARAFKIRVTLLSARRWLPLYLFRLPLMLIVGRYDIVHCHLIASNWLGKPLARLFGVPVVISHDQCNDSFRTDSALVQWIDRWANCFADQVFAVSGSIRDYLMKFENIPAERIRVIPNSLPERLMVERGESLSETYRRCRPPCSDKRILRGFSGSPGSCKRSTRPINF